MKYRIFETKIVTIKRNTYGFIEYEIIRIYWSDGSNSILKIPNQIHFIEHIMV